MKRPTRLRLAFLLGAFATGTLAQRAEITTLAHVRSIYIAPMDGGFDIYIAGALLKRLPKGVTITRDKNGADSVLEGSAIADMTGIGGTINQALGTGGAASAAVELVSSNGAILWADDRNDDTAIAGGYRSHGPTRVASRIAGDLAGALRDAEKKAAKAKK